MTRNKHSGESLTPTEHELTKSSTSVWSQGVAAEAGIGGGVVRKKGGKETDAAS